MKLQRGQGLRTDNANKLQAAIIGILTLIGVLTLLQITGERRGENTNNSHRHDQNRRLKPVRNFKNNANKVSLIKNDRQVETLSFDEELKLSFANLPRIHHVRKLSHEDLVHGQEFIIEAGKTVGRLIDDVSNDQAKAQKVITFLNHCANEKNMYSPVRALCLDYLVSLSKKHQVKFEIASVDPKIVELYNFVNN